MKKSRKHVSRRRMSRRRVSRRRVSRRRVSRRRVSRVSRMSRRRVNRYNLWGGGCPGGSPPPSSPPPLLPLAVALDDAAVNRDDDAVTAVTPVLVDVLVNALTPVPRCAGFRERRDRARALADLRELQTYKNKLKEKLFSEWKKGYSRKRGGGRGGGFYSPKKRC